MAMERLLIGMSRIVNTPPIFAHLPVTRVLYFRANFGAVEGKAEVRRQKAEVAE
jgi:hypothetical protein